MQQKAEQFVKKFSPVLSKHSVTLEIEANTSGQTTPSVVNNFVTSQSDNAGKKFSSLPENSWQVLSADQAREALTFIINKDLATGTEIFPSTTAKQYSQLFVELFSDSKFYCNATWTGSNLVDIKKISSDETDSGLVAVNKTMIGMAWFMCNRK
eukprot:TRINITY_DN3087_c0_g2_i1.p1 TRINITY_DN3087_c0_g2~~TRINITY_DN3087_c0_g2_i1.p1  ORF type:complete len:154 (-),score=23.90 TRINITY_DN3087_c0_g2_i1:14-475(-)